MANEQHSIATYVSDMLALEQLACVNFDTQAQDVDFEQCGNAGDLAKRLKAQCERHIDSLKQCLDEQGGHAAAPFKSAAAETAGLVEAALGKTRKTKVSKALRDDYATLALCNISYAELLATACGLHNASVAALAERHMRDYTMLAGNINESIASIVTLELQRIDLDIDTGTIDLARQAIMSVWRNEAPERTGSSRGVVEASSLFIEG